MAGELADEVTARDPRGQPETLTRRIGLVHRARDLEQVGPRVENGDAGARGHEEAGSEDEFVGGRESLRPSELHPGREGGIARSKNGNWRPEDESNVRPAPAGGGATHT